MTIDNATDETTPNASSPAASPTAPKWLAALGLAAGLGAVIASSCCVIALGLAAVGAGAGVFGGLELLAEWRIPFLPISALAIVGAWGAWWWKRPDACVAGSSCTSSERSRATLTLLLSASAVESGPFRRVPMAHQVARRRPGHDRPTHEIAPSGEGSDMSIEAIVFYILLVDAVSANVMVQFGSEWYVHNFRTISRWFPPAEGWALYYLALVLWVGSLLYRAGMLF